MDGVAENEIGNESRAMLEGNDLAKNMARLRLEGYGVDDDNEPAPENIPIQNLTPATKLSIYQNWNSCSICHRLSKGLRHEKAKLIEELPNPTNATYMDYFIYFLLEEYIKQILLVQTNKLVREEISWGEFLVYIGLWLLLATMSTGCDR